MSKRGLSAEEKRTRLLDLFNETKDFYKLAELEKLAPKAKGITQQSVKEVLQELIDDGLVKSDKIGAMNFYWCFPSDQGQSLTNKEDSLKVSVEALTKERDFEASVVEIERNERVDSDERTEMLRTLADLEGRLRVLQEEEAQYASCDPRLYAKKQALVEKLQNVALAWTDNISSALLYLAQNYGTQVRDQVKEELGLDDDFEDLSFPPP